MVIRFFQNLVVCLIEIFLSCERDETDFIFFFSSLALVYLTALSNLV
jgi:hypothetical protein